jgi:F-type H+-transporting ATPase subunit gamma
MANPRALDKRRKSIRNIRKITRTMELIATARFKKAMDRAVAATAYTQRLAQIVGNLASAGLDVSHPLVQRHDPQTNARLLLLTANRGLCGGYNSNCLRLAARHREGLVADGVNVLIDVSGKRGMTGLKFRRVAVDQAFLEFNDQPAYHLVEQIANRYIDEYVAGRLDRLDVAYTRFDSVSRQTATIETLLPLEPVQVQGEDKPAHQDHSLYEFLPSAESILEELVPTTFKVRLFKCFLDAAVSEQVARMVAMKNATENASDIIRSLSMTYNRARQSQITMQIMEVIGGAEALEA